MPVALQVAVLAVVVVASRPSPAASDGCPLGLLLLEVVLLTAGHVAVLAVVHVAVLAAVQVLALVVVASRPSTAVSDGCPLGCSCWQWCCWRRGGGTGTVGEDAGDVCMDVGVVTAREGRVVIGVMVMELVDEDVVHVGVSGDATGREVDEEEEGDTVEAVDVGVSACGWCL
ncbi:hypothetical protein NDU88_002078 [Pleurodeles waltl]|uniref:Secreted protein n=1 Tax=Pleurodeles waltl TaxID=8319 RepID=A0AAV7M4Y5_PLEWA|nr:hypothetical protein NDU88_002078 [Pleurodeles waltl]